MIDRAIAKTDAQNLLHPNTGPYWGPNRLSALTATVWHISDHYGQLVEYLRMKGSRRQPAENSQALILSL